MVAGGGGGGDWLTTDHELTARIVKGGGGGGGVVNLVGGPLPRPLTRRTAEARLILRASLPSPAPALLKVSLQSPRFDSILFAKQLTYFELLCY